MKKIVLVTGGSGLVGKAIQKISMQYDYDFIFLTSKMCDLTNYNDTLALFREVTPDYVLHLAANVGGLYKNMNKKFDMLDKNMLINYHVLKSSYEVNVKKLISCLSTCVFPDLTTYPIDETMLHNGPPHSSNDAYAYSKRMLDIYSQMYREEYNCDFTCVIPTNIYGPHDNYHLEDAHVIPALIHKCFLAKMNNTDFVVRGTGKPLRQFIYSLDLAKLMMWVLEDYKKKDNIILSVSEKDEISIGDAAAYIAKAMDFKGNLVLDNSFADGQYKKTADNSKLLTELSNTDTLFMFTPIEKGIQDSVKWFVENFDNCRK